MSGATATQAEAVSPAFLAQLDELVALDTVSPLDELRLEGAERLLAGYGCSRLGRELFGRGDVGSSTWVYCHLDTKPPVPRTGWETDPFRLTARGDRLHGLGISDSKFQLLDALLATEQSDCFLLIDTGEECGGMEAPELLRSHEVETIVVVDGAVGRFDVYAGLSGQVDGALRLRTGRSRLHPGRERTSDTDPDLLELIDALLRDLETKRLRFNLTDIRAAESERSLTLEEADLRFDLRFGTEERETVEAFVAGYEVEIRQWMEPLEGSETFEATALSVGPQAPFSSNLGGRGLEPRRVIVVPGAANDNRAHRPNEFVRLDQIGAHLARLTSVIEAIGVEVHGG